MTRGTVEYADIDVSPDGARLALATSGRREDLWVLDTASRELRRLTDDPAKDRGVGWSPDGRHLSVFSDRGGKYELWWIRADGSALEQLTRSDGSIFAPAWSPDGRRLAAGTMEKAFVFDLTGPLPVAPLEELPGLEDDEYFSASSWSGDGRRIVGTAVSSGTAEVRPGVVLYDVGDGSYVRIGDLRPMGGMFPAPPVWLPDDRHLVFGAGSDLMIVDRESGEQRRLLAAPSGSRYFQPRLTRDGRTLYYLRLQEESDLWIARLREAP